MESRPLCIRSIKFNHCHFHAIIRSILSPLDLFRSSVPYTVGGCYNYMMSFTLNPSLIIFLNLHFTLRLNNHRKKNHTRRHTNLFNIA